MNQPTMFSSGLELGNLVVSSDLLQQSWSAIQELYRETSISVPTLPFSIKAKVYQYPHSNVTFVAFISSPPCTTQHLQTEGRDLVSSDTLKEDFPLFQFVSTKVNPTFSLHRAAVTLFASFQDELSRLKDGLPRLKDQSGKIRPLIVTGHSIGGSIASLFTLRLLDSISLKDTTKRPMCITFGSPLLGDNGFQEAISERPLWNACFLHVASSQDPIPKLFTSPHNSGFESGSHTSVYKPFGTFLVCSQSGFACFEEPESALDLILAINSQSGGNRFPNEGSQSTDYGDILEKLKCGAICRGASELGGRDFSPLQTGIFRQIEAIQVETTQWRHENGDINSLIAKVEERTKHLVARKRNVFDPNKKLNDMKIHMTYMEWYKKVSVSRGGYYDCFKTEQSLRRREEIVKRKTILTKYWCKMVEEVEKMPQKEGAFFLTKWLYAGTNYRRMVEPLDIAEWYKKGKKDYIAGRSDHYKLLEKWVNDEKARGNQSNAKVRDRACSQTEDSLFWAYVEEAISWSKLFTDGETSPEDKESLMRDLVMFGEYVMDLIKIYAVSPEIFLVQSSFMQWWENIKGTSYDSPLAVFMRNGRYKRYA